MNSRLGTQSYLLAALLVVAFFASAAVGTDSSHRDAVPEFIDGGAIIALRPIVIKEGVSPQDLEKFAAEIYSPTWEKYGPGYRSYIMKGDRGQQKGEYVLIHIFDSQETRDFYFPDEEGGFSELAMEMGRDYPNVGLNAYVDTTALSTFTDYLVIR